MIDNNRSFPAWQTFAYKYQGREQEKFEDLARNLFRKEMGISYGLFQRVNHKGNETDVVEKDGRIIGFQAKYFSQGIDADNIIHSMKKAKEANPSQTHYYIYCNQSFGEPKRRKNAKKSDPIPKLTIEEEKIENTAKDLGLTLVWKLGNAILDEANANHEIYEVFFRVSDQIYSNVNPCTNSNEALKTLYDLIIEVTDAIDICVIYILNKGGISWYERLENRAPMFQSIDRLNRFITVNRYFFSDRAFAEVSRFYDLSVYLRCSLDCLVEAISTADDPDAIMDVYEITYDLSFQCNAKFVRGMMDEFKLADNHPAYDDFAEIYKQHELQQKRIEALINAKRDIAI